LANGGAFGAKATSFVPGAARALADQLGRPVLAVLRREDVVRLGPKRPPVAATAVFDPQRRVVHIDSAGPLAPPVVPSPVGVDVEVVHRVVAAAGPPVAHACRAPWAEAALLSHLALRAAGVEPTAGASGAAAQVALDSVAAGPEGGCAGARVDVDDAGRITTVRVRVAPGEVLDDVVLRSYCIGATHMALGWVLSEGLTVDPDSGAVLDLTVRSFGVVRPAAMPHVEVEVVADDRPACSVSDAVFVAVAAAVCDAVERVTGAFPTTFPARNTLRLT
jgi:CO/xanthine dehydrogenase Mo-binding subunit